MFILLAFSFIGSCITTFYLYDKPTVPVQISYTVVDKYEDHGNYFIIKSLDLNKAVRVNTLEYFRTELNKTVYETKREYSGVNKIICYLGDLFLILLFLSLCIALISFFFG